MKKLKYLLIVILFAAFAGEGFGQCPSMQPAVQIIPFPFISCGSGANFTFTSAFNELNPLNYIPYYPYNPTLACADNLKVWVVGEDANGFVAIGDAPSGSNTIYNWPSNQWAYNTQHILHIPAGVKTIYFNVGGSYDANYKTVKQTGMTGIGGNNHYNQMYKVDLWNHTPNFDVPTSNQTICSGASVNLTSTWDDLGIYNSTYTNTAVTHNNHNGVSVSWQAGSTNIGSGSSVNVSPSSTTTYTASFNYNNNCTTTDQVTITVIDNPALSTNISHICDGDPGSVSVDLAGFTNWTWNTSNIKLVETNNPGNTVNANSFSGVTATFTGITTGGVYHLEIERPNCSDYIGSDFTINVDNSASLSSTIFNPECFGGLTDIFVQATGGTPPYDVMWSNGYTTNTYPTNLNPGTYSVTVTTSKGCSSTLPGMVALAPVANYALSAGNIASVDASCLGLANGSIYLPAINGGVSPYSVSWSNGYNGLSNTNLLAGTYSFTITDNEGCTQSGSKTLVNANSYQLGNTTPTPDACSGIGEGQIILNPGNNTDYDYQWSTGETGYKIYGMAGTYTVTATSNGLTSVPGGCQIVNTYTITNAATAEWHRTTDNVDGYTDKVVKVLTDADNNVYVLGEFVGRTIMGFGFDAGASTQEGIFLVKFDECGVEQWGVHSEGFSTTLGINAIDIHLTTTSVIVYGQWNSNQGGEDFEMVPSDITNNSLVQINGSTDDNIFGLEVLKSTGALSNDTYYAVEFSDIVNQVVYDGIDTYFAGQFDNNAGVKKYTTSTSSWSDPIQDGELDNEVTAMALEGSNIFAVANVYGDYDFTGNLTSISGTQDAVILRESNSTVTEFAANADDFASVNDIIIDIDKQPWIAGQIQGNNSWMSVNSSGKTAMVIQFRNNLGDNQQFEMDENQASQLDEASAISLSYKNNTLYVGGTYTGQEVTFGNSATGFPHQTTPMSSAGQNADLWMAKYDFSDRRFIWIEGSVSDDAVNVTDIEYDGRNVYIAGSYQRNITFPNNGVDLTHPNSGANYFGYVVRGGDFLSAGDFGEYYKTGTNGTANNASDNSIDEENASQMLLYPNPNNGSFTIRYHAPESGVVNLAIYDITGRAVYTQTADKQTGIFEQIITPNNLPTGIYMLGMEINGETQYQKFLIQ